MDASIVIPTLARESLYPLVSALLQQETDMQFEVVLVGQPPGALDRARLPRDRPVEIVEEPLGRGFGHYRQRGADFARGGILAWIDDDECPRDRRWLENLAGPIRAGREEVVTAGTYIPLGQGYLTDCVSWLGLPGGAYPGFRTMWPVDAAGYTTHLCTGNFAIRRDTLRALGGFSVRQASGNEDTELGDRLRAAGVRIRYHADATVLHDARGLRAFAAWQIERGAAHRELLENARRNGSANGKIRARLASSLRILRMALFTRYFPGVLLTTLLQYFFQFVGYAGLRTARRYD